MSVYGRVEEVHQENREPLEYQIEQESHHRESSRLPLVKILLWSTLVTGITLGVPLLLDLMSAQEVQDFYAGWALHQTGKIYSDYYGSQGLLYYLLTYVTQGGFFFAIFEWLALVAGGFFLFRSADTLTEQGDQAGQLVTIFYMLVTGLAFGGGYAAMPIIQSEVVDAYHWLTLEEFTDLITISQMTPGPIAVNSATFVGIRIGGIPGAIVATLGCILPSSILLIFLSWMYMKYKKLTILQTILSVLRPAVVVLIAISGIKILQSAFGLNGLILDDIRLHMVFIFGISLVLLVKYNKNPISVILLSGILNLFYNILFQ